MDASVVQFTGMADIPAFESGNGDLGMKLQAQRKIPDCKCLVRVGFRPGKVKRARREIEGIAVPMEDG